MEVLGVVVSVVVAGVDLKPEETGGVVVVKVVGVTFHYAIIGPDTWDKTEVSLQELDRPETIRK